MVLLGEWVWSGRVVRVVCALSASMSIDERSAPVTRSALVSGVPW
ncbi:MAG: hypothetical protein QM606_07325 [Leucobacter sp.]